MSGCGRPAATCARSMRSTRDRTSGTRSSSPSRSSAPSEVRPANPPVRRTHTRVAAPWPPPVSSSEPVPSEGVDPRLRCHADRLPGLADGIGVLAGSRQGRRGEAREVGVGPHRVAGEGGVPDRAGAGPRGAADRGGRQMEGAVGDAGVEMHPAVVVLGLDVVVHGGALGVPAEERVVVGGAGGGHVAQAARVHPGQEEAVADQPVGLVDGLAEQPLLEAAAEDVTDRLVEGPGLALVAQPGGVLGDGVRQLVAQHVDRLGEPVEELAVAVAEHQLGAVPEGVVVVAARSARSARPGPRPRRRSCGRTRRRRARARR